MTALRQGDIVAIVGKIAGINEDGTLAEVNFHNDSQYSDEEVVQLETAGLRLMEHGDPDYGVKIIDGIEGEWTIHNRLSENVAVVQRVGSDTDDQNSFQVVAIDRLKTQDKDLYRLVTGAEIQIKNDKNAERTKAGNAPTSEQTPIGQAEEKPKAPVAPIAPTPPLTMPSIAPAAAKEPRPEAAIPPATPMMRPDKVAAPGQNQPDTPAAVDASITQTRIADAQIQEPADLSTDRPLGTMVRKATELHENRAETAQSAAPVQAHVPPTSQPLPELRAPSLTPAQPTTAADRARAVDLEAIAESETSYPPRA